MPLQVVIGGAEMGATREVFVKAGDGLRPPRGHLGLYNEKMVEVREGWPRATRWSINPKVLLGEDDKTKTRDADEGKNGEKARAEEPQGGGDPAKGGGPRRRRPAATRPGRVRARRRWAPGGGGSKGGGRPGGGEPAGRPAGAGWTGKAARVRRRQDCRLQIG